MSTKDLFQVLSGSPNNILVSKIVMQWYMLSSLEYQPDSNSLATEFTC